MDFAQQLVNGVQIGSVYALVAIGYTMVYGIAKMINFAHGDIIMVAPMWHCSSSRAADCRPGV